MDNGGEMKQTLLTRETIDTHHLKSGNESHHLEQIGDIRKAPTIAYAGQQIETKKTVQGGKMIAFSDFGRWRQ
jgi:hypothetical protein